jgi:hypothetical protein
MNKLLLNILSGVFMIRAIRFIFSIILICTFYFLCFAFYREAHTSPMEWLIQFIVWGPIIWLYQFPCSWVAGYFSKKTTVKKSIVFLISNIMMGIFFATAISYITFSFGSAPVNYFLRLYIFSLLFSILFWLLKKNTFNLEIN